MKKSSLILFLYIIAVFFILRAYYNQPENTGMPNPKVLMAPTYLYGILALTSGFLEGFPIVLAAALTVSLIWQTGNTNANKKKKVN